MSKKRLSSWNDACQVGRGRRQVGAPPGAGRARTAARCARTGGSGSARSACPRGRAAAPAWLVSSSWRNAGRSDSSVLLQERRVVLQLGERRRRLAAAWAGSFCDRRGDVRRLVRERLEDRVRLVDELRRAACPCRTARRAASRSCGSAAAARRGARRPRRRRVLRLFSVGPRRRKTSRRSLPCPSRPLPAPLISSCRYERVSESSADRNSSGSMSGAVLVTGIVSVSVSLATARARARAR